VPGRPSAIPITCGDGAPHPGPSPLRRLTHDEYDNTVRDLLGDTSQPARAFAPEEEAFGFTNNATARSMTPLRVEQYAAAAEALATRATESLGALLPCDPAAIGESECARAFIASFGRRAYRRPLEPSEIDGLVALYERGVELEDLRAGIRMTIEAMVQSPHFLYRVELGGEPAAGGDGIMRPTAWQMASRLSYLLWGTMPDAELDALADAGGLRTAADIEGTARRMLSDARTAGVVRSFHEQWLDLDLIESVEKDPLLYPELTPDVRGRLREQAATFIESVVWRGDGTIASLLGAPFDLSRDAALAPIYGADPAGARTGVLALPALVAIQAKANQSSPVLRGKLVRERFLCQPLPPPPGDVMFDLPEPDPSSTTRERFAAHSTDPACAGCHVLMDPVGLGFEHFDGAGRWRDDENGQPVDARGELMETDVDGAFDGTNELAARLTTSDQVRACIATEWLRFAIGRGETDADVCSEERLLDRLRVTNGSLTELVVALTQTDAFMYRTAGEGETP